MVKGMGRSSFQILALLSFFLVLNAACPRPVPPAPQKESTQKVKKTSKSKKKKKKHLKRTITTVEKSESRYPCQKHRCEEAYRTFSVRHQAHQKKVGAQHVTTWLKKMKKKKAPPAQGLKGQELKEKIIEQMNIGFLLSDIQKERQVRTHHKEAKQKIIEEVLEVIDPHVGRFDILLLSPKNQKTKRAILALHGHGDHPNAMARKYMGRQLAEEGYAVAIPRIRAHDCYKDESAENIVAKDLWAHGFSLMGLHVYEALVTQHIIQNRKGFDIKTWGIIGHSGGSSLANLLPRLSDGFQAKVVDYYVDFNNRCGPERIHCETFGPLVPLANDINNEKTSTTPFLKVPYDYKKYKTKILKFFAKHL